MYFSALFILFGHGNENLFPDSELTFADEYLQT